MPEQAELWFDETVFLAQNKDNVGALGRKGGNAWYGLPLNKRSLPKQALG